MSNFLICGVFQMIFTQKVLNVIEASFHRSRLIFIGNVLSLQSFKEFIFEVEKLICQSILHLNFFKIQ